MGLLIERFENSRYCTVLQGVGYSTRCSCPVDASDECFVHVFVCKKTGGMTHIFCLMIYDVGIVIHYE